MQDKRSRGPRFGSCSTEYKYGNTNFEYVVFLDEACFSCVQLSFMTAIFVHHTLLLTTIVSNDAFLSSIMLSGYLVRN